MLKSLSKSAYFRENPAVRDVLEACPPLEGERYKDGQLIFRRSSNQQQLMLEWLARNVVSQWESDTLRFLSIGAGTGIFDTQLLREFLKRDLQIQYEGIDPNAEVLRLLEESLRPLEGAKLEARAILSDFESFQTPKRFDFILLVHTHYFFCDLRQSLQKAWDLLADGGSIVVYSALDIFLSQFFNVTFESNFGHPPWLSHHVQEALNGLGFPFRRESIHAELDISACFGADAKAAHDLLAFIIHADATDKSGVDILLACLKQNAVHENGRHLLPHTVDVFQIHKT